MKKVIFSFLNSKNELKKVFVMVDEETFAILPKLTETDRVSYLVDLYHDQEREKHHHRKIITFSRYSMTDDEILNIASDENLEERCLQKKLIKQIFEYLSPKDRRYMELRFYENLTYEEISIVLNVSFSTVRRNMSRILADLKNHFKS